ncbi:P-loop containing nucleoside triphosphate hydrolase protein [Haematococcus lacustris]
MLRRQVQDVEGKLPPKVAVVVKVPMTPYQSAVYNWVKATSTIRFYPGDPLRAKMKHDFCPLNNKVMELRKVCNHPLLSFPADPADGFELMRQCGKLVMLDRMLVKFCHTGHRVLLFCTMTKLLDLLEVYLRSRTLPNGQYMAFRRIDGSTPLEMRESAIKEFNSPNTDVFIFLLSIRAAGRGLNLQVPRPPALRGRALTWAGGRAGGGAGRQAGGSGGKLRRQVRRQVQ